MLIPMEKEQREKAMQASQKLTLLLREFSEMELDPDFASYILTAAGIGLAIEHNHSSPMVVTELLSVAIRTANETVAHGNDMDDIPETKH
jgi:hypothetical protein